ncbi:MAG: VCBS repeat-containing protein [Kofleriaceae bacterium]
MRSLELLVVGAALCACGFPRPDRVGPGNGDGGVDVPLPPGQLVSFGFSTTQNTGLVHDLHGAFSPDRGTIHSIGFQLDRTAMTPMFATSDPGDVVEVGGEVQLSARNAHDFTGPVLYQVTSTTGDVNRYAVTVESRGLPQPTTIQRNQISDLAVADVDGDGKPDIVLAGTDAGDLEVYLDTTDPGSPTPGFALPSGVLSGLTPSRVVLADLNGDGKPEMIAGESGTTLSIVVNTTTQPGQVAFAAGRPQPMFGTDVQAIAAGDLNGDGKLDLATSDTSQNLVHEALNQTTVDDPTMIAFSAVSTTASGALPADLALADCDGDGVLDTVVADQNEAQVQVILGATQSSDTMPYFGSRRSAALQGPYRLAITDLDHDGDPDVLVTTKSKPLVAVLTNDGHGQMGVATPATTYPTVAVAVLDLDGDGFMDFVVASTNSSNGGAVEAFINPANGTTIFHDQTSVSLTSEPIAAAVGDFNGDGIEDLVIATSSGFSVYLMGGP